MAVDPLPWRGDLHGGRGFFTCDSSFRRISRSGPNLDAFGEKYPYSKGRRSPSLETRLFPFNGSIYNYGRVDGRAGNDGA